MRNLAVHEKWDIRARLLSHAWPHRDESESLLFDDEDDYIFDSSYDQELEMEEIYNELKDLPTYKDLDGHPSEMNFDEYPQFDEDTTDDQFLDDYDAIDDIYNEEDGLADYYSDEEKQEFLFKKFGFNKSNYLRLNKREISADL